MKLVRESINFEKDNHPYKNLKIGQYGKEIDYNFLIEDIFFLWEDENDYSRDGAEYYHTQDGYKFLFDKELFTDNFESELEKKLHGLSVDYKIDKDKIEELVILYIFEQEN